MKKCKESSSPCIYAGWHVPDLVSPRKEFYDAVHMVQEGIIGYAIRKYTHGKKLGNTSCVTRVNFGLIFTYNLNKY